MWCLGLAGGYLHDAAACLFFDDELIFCIEEERLSKIRYAINSLPRLSIIACLEEANIKIQDIDVIALSWNPLFPKDTKSISADDPAIKELFPENVFGKVNAQIIVVDHHLAHASIAFRTSGATSALVLSVDGDGDGKSLAVYRGENDKLIPLGTKDTTQSLGWFYQHVTTYLGMRWVHSGKTMALAAYGEPKYKFDFFHIDEGNDFSFDPLAKLPANAAQTTSRESNWAYQLKQREKLYKYLEKLGIPVGKETHFDRLTGMRIYEHPYQQSIDLAASAQKVIEDALVAIVTKYGNEQKLSTVCLAGGVAMNCKAIGELLYRVPGLQNVYVPPGASDMGGAMGAALEVLSQLGIHPYKKITNAYWGYGFSDGEIAHLLKNLGLKTSYLSDPSDCASDLISQGYVVGWFQGKMEFGARALGNRSILARPDSKRLSEKINLTIKNREVWRPFSPSVIESDFLSMGWEHASQASPFMTIALRRMEENKEFSGVTHIDNTSRIQLVTYEDNPRYFELISAVGEKIGYPAVLNTSLNARDEPIACRPIDAVRVFATTPIDAMVIGRNLLRKETGPIDY